jgi:ankyrin repeat protein
VKVILEQDRKYRIGAEETSPLYISAQEGYLDVVKLLVEAGQDVEYSYREGFTPLYIAAQRGKLDVVEYLYSQGANPNVKCKYRPLRL